MLLKGTTLQSYHILKNMMQKVIFVIGGEQFL